MIRLCTAAETFNRVAAVAAVCGAFALSACSSAPPIVPAELKSFAKTRSASTVWTTSVDNAGSRPAVRFAPYVTDTAVFAVGASGQVNSLDRATGKVNWSVKLNSDVTAGISGDDSLLFLASGSGEVYCLRQDSGARVWAARTSSEVIAAPVAGSDFVIARSIDGRIYAFDKLTGRQRWRYSYKVPALSLHGNGRALIGTSEVLAGLDNGRLVALRNTDGRNTWETSLSDSSGRSEVDKLNDLDADIRTDGLYIYAVNYQGVLAQIDPTQGSFRWTTPMSATAGFAIGDGVIVVTDEFDSVWGISTADGSVLWEQDAFSYRKLTAPAIVDETTVAVGDFQGYIHLLSSVDGSIIGRHRAGRSQIMTQPVVRDGTGYVQMRKGKLASVQF